MGGFVLDGTKIAGILEIMEGAREVMELDRSSVNVTAVVVTTRGGLGIKILHHFCPETDAPYPIMIPLRARGWAFVMWDWMRTKAVTPKGRRWRRSGRRR